MPNPERFNIPNKFELHIALTNPEQCTVSQINLLKILSNLPPESQSNMLQVAFTYSNKFVGERWAVALRESTESMLTSVQKAAKSFTLKNVALIAVAYLSIDAWHNICEWWHGRISGQRCAKNIIDCGIGLAAGVGGGALGGALGTMISPGVGTVFGGFIGGAVATGVGHQLSDWMTLKIFRLPKSVALENAFRFMGLPQDASNNEINSKYKGLCLRYHPDRGGRTEDFQKIQIQ